MVLLNEGYHCLFTIASPNRNWQPIGLMILKALKEAARWVLPVWYERWFLWLTLFGIAEIINQVLYSVLDGIEASQVAYLLASLFGSSIDFVLALLVPPVFVALRNNTKAELSQHLNKYFNQACIESLRSTARACWYGYLFIIPGLVKMLRLQFVPYIVQFDSQYDLGRKDALKESEKLSKGHLFSIFVLFCVLSLLVLVESVRQSFEWDTPAFAVAFILTLPIRIYTQMSWFLYYEALVARRNS